MSVPQPNILLIVSDEERRNDWLDGVIDLPAHQRLRAGGLDFSSYYTHTSPCSPSRASLYTGQYVNQHGVNDNVSFPAHTALDPSIPTLGSLLRSQGYESAYLGKWHLSGGTTPNMESYGYSSWTGNDEHFTGNAWTGRYFDPDITDQAVDWLRRRPVDRPWFLTVALVNPHDVMWFPIDHPSYQANHPDEKNIFDLILKLRLDGVPLAPPPEDYPRRFDRLPANFGDDLFTKPEVQRAWRHCRNTEHFCGSIDLADTDTWLRQLDYYAYLHEELDTSLTRIIDTLDAEAIYDDTVIIYTSDHGDACGSHGGLRAKLPCVYEEVMGVPLIIKAPGLTSAGATTAALGTHVDLAATIASLAGVDSDDTPSLSGRDLTPVLADPAATVRDYILFAQDSAQSELIRNTRYAVRGFFDGSTKYARYYGVGGGIERDGTVAGSTKLYDVDAAFDDHDHEWYEMGEDPLELVNLANDRGRRQELRAHFDRLLDYESAELG